MSGEWTLVDTLENCAAPDDQDVVKGVLAAIFGGLPADMRGRKYEDVLRKEDMCRVRLLRKLTVQKLAIMGISMGDAEFLLETMRAAVGGAPAEAGHSGGGRRPGLRPFPKLGPTKYPELAGWRQYRTGLRVRVQPEVSVLAQKAMLSIEKGGGVPVGWTDGCADDVVIF